MTLQTTGTDGQALHRPTTAPNTPLTDPTCQIPASHPAITRLPAAEQRQFCQFGTGPAVRPDFELIHQGFEHFVALQPDACAIREAGGREVSYRTLNTQANALAAHLQRNQISRGDHVCLFVRRGIEMVVGILACLKLGASYVPQDMQLCPSRQRRHIVETVAATVILTTRQYEQTVSEDGAQKIIAIDRFLEQPAGIHIEQRFFRAARPEDTAVVIFTSGTTGKANGVQVTHANLVNILLTAPGNMGIRPGDKVAQQLNIAFDMAAWEILGCLGNGGTLLIRDKDFQATAEQADVLIATPSILATLDASRCHQVRAVAVAGEPCPQPLADIWGAFCDFYNSCGPTETTIINTAEIYRPGDPVLSIGRPTPNNTVYVLNDKLEPCRIGETGEMWAGGICVSKGYINNPELTAERYRDDPFLGNGQKMFRTRDLGRWTADGTLEHFGRVDDQVKIRGFRVELDAVSAVLEQAENCNHAVALKLNSRHLAAFVSPANVDPDEARQHVLSALPYYCEPLFIIAVDELPKTIRGKVDKRALAASAAEYHRSAEISGETP
ncbi:amino acid adenylation domain-containing protein [Aliamphritea hakodatensis]|uniref:amino acid adenylation domain-containing protein n=1 Tax=Aliamphritea hakodatensis TaxID=2895352 RepID=UPI0022FD938F|nr:amino acid adenylation domain-containing protein [Aliamphritea hakodatensis]